MSVSDVGHGITVRRAILRMTQAELARRVGVGRSYISMLENGERPLSDEMLKSIATALECKPEDFAGEWVAK